MSSRRMLDSTQGHSLPTISLVLRIEANHMSVTIGTWRVLLFDRFPRYSNIIIEVASKPTPARNSAGCLLPWGLPPLACRRSGSSSLLYRHEDIVGSGVLMPKDRARGVRPESLSCLPSPSTTHSFLATGSIFSKAPSQPSLRCSQMWCTLLRDDSISKERLPCRGTSGYD